MPDRSDLIQTPVSKTLTIAPVSSNGNSNGPLKVRPTQEVEADKENEVPQKKGGRGGRLVDAKQVIRPMVVSATAR